MKTFELARVTVAPDDAQEFQARWPKAVDAIRATFPGLEEANLVQLDETTWLDIWRWESHEAAVSAAEGAPKIPDAASMFELIKEVVKMEHGEIAQHWSK